VLKWDAWNRLVKVSTPTGTVVAEYAYDGITRRVLKRAAGVSTHYYYNSQWRPVEEREEAVSEVSATYDWGIRYRDDLVRRTKLLAPPNPGSSSSSGEGSSGGSGSGPLPSSGSGSAEGSSAGSPLPASSSALEASWDPNSVFEGSSGEGSFSSASAGSIASSGSSSGSVPRSPVTHYALHDYYNVTAITDIGGAVVERYGYSAFGDTRYMTPGFVDRTGSFYEWDLLFKAQFRDEETGYYNYGYRYYVALLGRWINRDPIEEKGGINLYAFTGNNPANHTDHLGLYIFDNENLPTSDYDRVKRLVGELEQQMKNIQAQLGRLIRCVAGAILEGEYDAEVYSRRHPGIGGALSQLLNAEKAVERIIADIPDGSGPQLDLINKNLGGSTYGVYSGRKFRDTYLDRNIELNIAPSHDWTKQSDSAVKRTLLHELSHASAKTNDVSDSLKNAHEFETLAEGDLCSNSLITGLITKTGMTCCCNPNRTDITKPDPKGPGK
jgi:RHS repeat-associated protein